MRRFPVPTPVTTDWLTAVLRHGGYLPQGDVLAVTQRASDTFNSRTQFLQLRYSVDTLPGLPTHFVLKQNGPAEWAKTAGAEEVKFYQLIATLTDHPLLIIPCYAAGYEENSGDSYLLLEDLSTTHAPPVTRDEQIGIEHGVPSKMVIGAVVDTLAKFHAYWWQHRLLMADAFPIGFWTRNADRFGQYLARRRISWERLYEREHAWFPAELRVFYEQLFAHLETHWERYLQPRFAMNENLTLIHGDAYFTNFLSPKAGATGRTYLLDWQSPSFDLGAYDLVNLCATFWTSKQRNKLDREMSILQRYHHGLLRHGVTGYPWEQLLADYRSALIFWVLMPVQDGADGAAKEYWWPKMQCLVAAFHEWECLEMLGILE